MSQLCLYCSPHLIDNDMFLEGKLLNLLVLFKLLFPSLQSNFSLNLKLQLSWAPCGIH